MINSYYNPYQQDHDLLNNLGTLGATYKLNYDQFKDMGNSNTNSNIGAGFRTGLGILQLASHSYAQKKARQKVVNPYYQTPYAEGGEFDYDTEYEKYYSGNTDVSEQADFSPDEEQAMNELYGGFEKENRIIDEILPMSSKSSNTDETGQYAFNYLQSKGYSPNVAAAIAGNLKQESNFNPDAVGDNGASYGIAQWQGNRRRLLHERYGPNPSIEQQLDFLVSEPGESHILEQMKSLSPEDGAMLFAKNYERPNPQYANYAARQQYAKTFNK